MGETLRIVSWNCHCTFGKGLTKQKAEGFLVALKEENFDPQILVIQEINGYEIGNLEGFTTSHWYGDHKNGEPGGIAIFLKAPYRIKCISEFDPNYRYVVPYHIINDSGSELTLYSVWTKDGYKNYQVPVFNILESSAGFPTENSIFIGDFNTGANEVDSDNWYKKLETAMQVHRLKNFSVSGKELNPTFFRGSKSWVNDHCFGSSNMKVNNFQIGGKDKWIKPGLSDHCPIIVDFELA